MRAVSAAAGSGRAAVAATGQWRERPEAGNWLGMWFIRAVGLHLGRPAARALLYPVTLYFYLRRGPERRAVRDYFRRLDGGRRSRRRTLALMHAYAATILDRVFLLARGLAGFNVSIDGQDELLRQLGRGRGVLLLGAHVGSFDVLRALSARHPDLPLRLVMDRAKTPTLTMLLESLAPELADTVVDTARGGADVVLALADVLRAGGMATLLGDRGRPGEPMRAVPFLGASAPFPVAPWRIAAVLGVPVVLCLGMYEGGNRYHLVFETLAERVELPAGARGPALDAYLARYAQRLEHHLRRAPGNWFNFFDFWDGQGAAVPRASRRGGLERAHAA